MCNVPMCVCLGLRPTTTLVCLDLQIYWYIDKTFMNIQNCGRKIDRCMRVPCIIVYWQKVLMGISFLKENTKNETWAYHITLLSYICKSICKKQRHLCIVCRGTTLYVVYMVVLGFCCFFCFFFSLGIMFIVWRDSTLCLKCSAFTFSIWKLDVFMIFVRV